MKKKIDFLDLRLLIGLFFLTIGLILVFTPFFYPADQPWGASLNLYSGLAMVGFGSIMLMAYGYDHRVEKSRK